MRCRSVSVRSDGTLDLSQEDRVIPVSSLKRTGQEDLLSEMEALLEGSDAVSWFSSNLQTNKSHPFYDEGSDLCQSERRL